jgi:hypothetical protein
VKRHVLTKGERFGKLVILEDAAKISGRCAYLCACDCGKQIAVRSMSLLRGAGTRSCGCLVGESIRSRSTVHRHATRSGLTPEFSSWRAMIKRCTSVKGNRYHRYGNRGITVCQRWSEFHNFLEDMGSRPEGTSLDRIDNDGNYEPGNCRWANSAQQARNTRKTRLLTFNGETLCMLDWSERLNVRYRLLQYHLSRNNWDPQLAFPTLHQRYPKAG